MKIRHSFLVLCVFELALTGCQASNYLTHEDCDADRDGDFAAGECGGNDCDDQDNRRSSLLAELCGDGIDNNCNGVIDRADPDCVCNANDPPRDCFFDQTGSKFTIVYPTMGGLNASTCRPGQQQCVAGTWGPCLGAQGPLPETCDTKDNDCDGSVDEDFNAGAACTAGTGSCSQMGKLYCKDQMPTCDAMKDMSSENYLITKRNGSFDNNCDGRVDMVGCDSSGICGPLSLSTTDILCTVCLNLGVNACTWQFQGQGNLAPADCGKPKTGIVCQCGKSGLFSTCKALPAIQQSYTIGCK